MLRFKKQTRRDHVVSLLPPISVIKNKEPSVQERIYSDTPPPVKYTGSFPAKVLRHLDKSTFYSTPTKGETLLANKTMHDEERRGDGKKDVKKLSSDNKDSRTDHHKKNKTTKSKIKNKRNERKEDGMKENERRCISAPGFKEENIEEQVIEAGNLTAPVTPRCNALTNDTRKSAGKTSRVNTPTRSTTPGGFASPDLRIIDQDAEVVLELRGDRIETGSHFKDFRIDSNPPSRAGTPCRLDWQGRISEQGMYPDTPKIRSAIRQVPCAQNRVEKVPKDSPKFEIRAVGFSLPYHKKCELNSNLRTKEKKNDPKIIKIPRAEGEDPSMSGLATVTEAEDTSRDDEEKGPKSETDSAKELTSKENNNSQENEQTESKENTKDDSNEMQNVSDENAGNEPRGNTKIVVKSSEKLEELVIKKPENENGKEDGSGNGNEATECKTENETDVMKDKKKKKSPMDKKGGCRNSKNRSPKK